MSVNQVAILRVFPGKLMERNRKNKLPNSIFSKTLQEKKINSLAVVYIFNLRWDTLETGDCYKTVQTQDARGLQRTSGFYVSPENNCL